jgi:formylglycine-generating enzyme required for sulfatase activity
MIDHDWIVIPAGPFLMGSDPRDAAPPFPDEQPLHELNLSAFRISRVPVTNRQYQVFVEATGHSSPGHWLGSHPPAGTEDHPVTYVDWRDARAFCAWAGVRLPTEAEWEKAARGPARSRSGDLQEARWWPWGNELPSRGHGHFDGQSQGLSPAAQGVMPAGSFPAGASPYGALDMAGNVWEWTQSRYQSYPYDPSDGREAPSRSGARVVRGGSYNHGIRHIRCAARAAMAQGVRDLYIGFRVAAADARETAVAFDWVDVPFGTFWMGSEPGPPARAVFPDEMPRHQVTLAAFAVARTPVTNEHYRRFVAATGHPAPPHWLDGGIPRGLGRRPVTHVDWRDALSYCDWAGVRLLTEAEWERAAAGSGIDFPPRIFPWGDDPPIAARLNFRRAGGRIATTPVDRYPRGATPAGVLDLAGNVWEWVSTCHALYPYDPADGREDRETPCRRVLRGGSLLSPGPAYVRCAMRSLSHETRRREHIGFRVARDA